MRDEKRFIVVAFRGRKKLPLWVDGVVGDEIKFRGVVSGRFEDIDKMYEEDAKDLCAEAMKAYEKRLCDQRQPTGVQVLSELRPDNLEFFLGDCDELPGMFPELAAKEDPVEQYERRCRLKERVAREEHQARIAAKLRGSRRPPRSTLRFVIGAVAFVVLEYLVAQPLMDYLFIVHTSTQSDVLSCAGGGAYGDCITENGVRAYDSTWWAFLGNSIRLLLGALALGVAYSVRKVADRWSIEGRETKIR